MNQKNKLFEKLFGAKNVKKYLIPVLLIGAALLLIVFTPAAENKTEDNEPDVAMGVLSKTLEDKVRHMCEKVEGVGNVYVMLTLDTSEEYVYASDTETSDSYLRSEFVIANGGGGVELYVICPKVRGVAVVCDGGDRATVKKTLTELISSALGIPSSSISIAGT